MRLPFGLICAQDIFQRKVDETFGDLTGVTGIADDIVVYGYNSDFNDHDENLRAVLQRARETGLRFNLDKCKFRCTRIPFFGHIIGAEGLQPDPRNIDSILSMDPSTSLADLQTFLGMVQFLSRFIPNLASRAASLWSLTKNTSDFVWSPEHQSDTDRNKKAIVTSLQYFDNTQPGKAIQGLDVYIHEVHLHLNDRPTRVSQIQEETTKDTTLSSIGPAQSHYAWMA